LFFRGLAGVRCCFVMETSGIKLFTCILFVYSVFCGVSPAGHNLVQFFSNVLQTSGCFFVTLAHPHHTLIFTLAHTTTTTTTTTRTEGSCVGEHHSRQSSRRRVVRMLRVLQTRGLAPRTETSAAAAGDFGRQLGQLPLRAPAPLLQPRGEVSQLG
jgi:hypothetical protein